MPVIKLPNPALLPKDAVVLDLGDLHRQGEAILAQARERAAQIVAQANAERARLLGGAAEEGRAKGYAEGLQSGRKDGVSAGQAQALVEERELIAKLGVAWTDALERFLAHRDRLMGEGRQEVVRLAAAIAQRVVKRQIELDPTVVADQLGAVLELVMRPSRLMVSINPQDRAVVEAALPDLIRASAVARHAEVVDDPALARGSCVVHLGEVEAVPGGGAAAGLGGRIDGSIGTQLDRMVEALLPGERGRMRPNATEGGGTPAPAAGGLPLSGQSDGGSGTSGTPGPAGQVGPADGQGPQGTPP